jgi:hypothetical protein
MADLNQFEEKSDLFLRGEMSPKEAKDFQNQLDSDPLLKSEFEMNNSIVEGIKQFRSAQLKARLSAITISPLPVNFWAGVGTAAIVTGITATLIYQSIQDEPIELPDETQTRTEDVQGTGEGTDEAYDISQNFQEEDLTTDSKEPSQKQNLIIVQAPAISDPENESINEVIEREILEENESEPAQINLPHGPEENSNIERSGDGDVSSLNRVNAENEKFDVDVKQHPEYSFHYSYSDHKLFIYGSLDKEPYRLLELDQKGKNSLYLAYDGKYYYLKDQTINPVPLKPIRDRNLLKNLRELDSGN